jgi:pyruvate dehydrogenase E2 component (dihydrolipoamide acetyltransferase)
LHIGIEEGQSAPVDSLLAIIGNQGEDITPMLHFGKSTNKQETPKVEEIKDEAPEDEVEAAATPAPEKSADALQSATNKHQPTCRKA